MTKKKEPNEYQPVIDFLAANANSVEDVQNLLKKIVWPTLETLLKAEVDNHLGYKKHAKEWYNSGNSRNWSYKKKLHTTSWEIEIEVPRDRNWEFEPKIVPKYEASTSEIEQKIINMYWLGLTTSDIQYHVKDIYGANISPSMVSSITDKILPEVKLWQSRPLESCYPIVYLDAIHYKVKSNGKYENKAVYVMLWIGVSWIKEIIGLYIWENESASFRQKACNDLANRWVEEILIACIDGLAWFATAIKNTFPSVEIQRCIIHQIRSSMRYVNYQDYKVFIKDLKLIYQADTLEVAEEALSSLEKKRSKKYPISVNSWINNRWDLSTYFVYPKAIRKIIYTTNTIESYNRGLRKVTKTTSVFPHEDALLKLLYLATMKIQKKRQKPLGSRGSILGQFESFFPGKISKYLH